MFLFIRIFIILSESVLNYGYWPCESIPNQLELEEEILHIQNSKLPEIKNILQNINSHEDATNSLQLIYSACQKEAPWRISEEAYRLSDMIKKLETAITHENKLKKNYDHALFIDEIERLETLNYYNNKCLKNLIYTYIVRYEEGKPIVLLYPLSGLYISSRCSESIGGNLCKVLFLKNAVARLCVRNMPFYNILVAMFVKDNNRMHIYNYYVDVYQLDPNIFHPVMGWAKDFCYVRDTAGSLRISCPTIQTRYRGVEGYQFESIRIYQKKNRERIQECLESTRIIKLLSWSPEQARNHNRYVKETTDNGCVKITLKLMPPCKAEYLHLHFKQDKLIGMHYSPLLLSSPKKYRIIDFKKDATYIYN